MNMIPVVVCRNNERCETKWEWVVCVAVDPELWLDVFDSKEDAIDFCKRNGLPYTVKGAEDIGERI